MVDNLNGGSLLSDRHGFERYEFFLLLAFYSNDRSATYMILEAYPKDHRVLCTRRTSSSVPYYIDDFLNLVIERNIERPC